MTTLFPVLRQLIENQPHDCLIVTQDITLAKADKIPCQLIAGPLEGNSDTPDPDNISQTMYWSTFADLAAQKLGPGVHHLRCFAARYGDKVEADVFLDGNPWPEAGQRIRDLAGTWRAPTQANPYIRLRQHLLTCAKDVAVGIKREETLKQAEWAFAVQAKLGDKTVPHFFAVLTAAIVMSRFGDINHTAALVERGIAPEVADQLAAFLPSAAARIFLADQFTFPAGYIWTNPTNGRAVERQYDETPVWLAALEVLRALHETGLASIELNLIFGPSAEANLARQMQAKGLTGGKFSMLIYQTDEQFEGEKLDAVMARVQARSKAQTPEKKKPWWQVWS